jgi:glutamine---fructose-6-phosphate transaminase (isomerizing)
MSENNMLAQIESLPELIRSEIDPLYRKIRTLLTPEDIYSIKRIILTGCGDSFFAGLSTEMAFETISGMPVEVMSSMQASRFGVTYQPKSFPRNPLVIAVSVSGGVARTVEAIKMARAEGALTVGITASPNSRLAQSAEKVLDCTVPAFPDAPGVRSYRVSLMALYLMAIRMAEVSGKLTQDEAACWVIELKKTADVIEKTLQIIKSPIQELARKMVDVPGVEFIGHGPNYASALFCAAKVIEAAGVNSSGQDTEEWAHLQYFLVQNPQTPAFIISPGDRGHGRAAELLAPMKRVGRTIVAVVPENDCDIAPQSNLVLPVVGTVKEVFNPMVYCLAGELYAAFLAEASGEEYFRRSRVQFNTGNNGISTSRVIERSELYR